MVTKWTGEYSYNVYGFCLENYWFWFVFSRYREALPLQLLMTYSNLVNYTLLSKTEIFFFSLWLVPPETGDRWVLSSLIRWMGKTVCLLACTGILIFWGPRMPPRQNLMAGLWHGFPGLERPLGIQSKTPEEFHHRQFGKAYVVSWPDLIYMFVENTACFKSTAKSTCTMLVWQLGISNKMYGL